MYVPRYYKNLSFILSFIEDFFKRFQKRIFVKFTKYNHAENVLKKTHRMIQKRSPQVRQIDFRTTSEQAVISSWLNRF